MAQQRGRLVFGASLAVVAALVSACDQPPNNRMRPNPGQQFQELMERPDIEQASRRYTAMMATMRDRLAAEIGLRPWEERPDSSSKSSCRDYPEIDTVDKESRSLPRWAIEANVPDDKWSHAIQIVREVAGKYGFGSPQTLVDAPGRHEISIKDSYNAEINFGTRVNTSLQVLTGCHLTADAHRRGQPSTR